jgi:hypothetical protein
MTNKNEALKLLDIATHQLEHIYPFVGNPRIFIGILKLLVKVHELIPGDELAVFRLDHMKSLLEKHKQSPVVFPREDVVVVCTADYNFTSINKTQMMDLLKQTTQMVNQC